MVQLSERCMLVSLEIRRWSAQVQDRKVTREVTEAAGAELQAGVFRKNLIAKDALKEVQKIAGEARLLHYFLTLPWSDTGYRILPTQAYFEYTGRMGDVKTRYLAAVGQFLSSYAEERERSKVRLGLLFSEQDYPDVESLRSAYAFEVRISPVPEAGDFRCTLDAEERAEIQRDITERVTKDRSDAMRSVWERVHDATRHMSERLRDYSDAVNNDQRSQLHQSLVTNLVELCHILPALNIDDDPNLEAMRQDVERQLCDVDIGDLKSSAEMRDRVADDAQRLADACAAYFGESYGG